ncbi:MAG: hypothetical protein VKJ66_03100 [Synechococcus sp.]|nr:hypothetical protein [Synechococcus sp.]
MVSPLPPSAPADDPAPTPPRPRFQGNRVVMAVVVGTLIGASVGLFLESIVRNVPTDLDTTQLVWIRRLLGAAGALSGLAIETMRQLQATSQDPAYHQRKRGLRGRW